MTNVLIYQVKGVDQFLPMKTVFEKLRVKGKCLMGIYLTVKKIFGLVVIKTMFSFEGFVESPRTLAYWAHLMCLERDV